MEKKLKTALIILIMILICLVGFGGIYLKNNIFFKNILPNYELGTKLEGTRLTTFKLDDTVNEEIYDANGNKVDSIPEGESEENYTKKEVAVNPDEIKNKENYNKVKDIMIKRLQSLGMSNYEVRVDEESGNISVELNENSKTDDTLSELIVKGKFEVIDSEDKTVLMDTNDLKDVSVLYNNTTSGISVYLNMQFNKEGTKKLAQISKEYPKVEATDNTEKSEETTNESTDETESTETEETNKEKKVTINIDGNEFLSTSFQQTIEDGELTVTIGSASTDTDTLSEYITTAQYYATILDNGEIPLTYKAQSTEFIQSLYSDAVYTYVVLGILGVIALISVIYMIIKYKKLGVYTSIIYIASIALIAVLIRLTKIQINIETIISAIMTLILLDYANLKLLKSINKEDNVESRKDNLSKAYRKILDVFIIGLIPAIVLTYNSLLKLSNIGMALFWGIVIVAIMNLAFTRTILIVDAKK